MTTISHTTPPQMTRTIQTARMSHASSGRPAIIEVIDLTMEKPAKNPTTAKPPKKLVEPPTHKPATNPARKPAKQKLEMDSMVQTKLDGFACMRPHVARQELLDSGRRSKKKSKKKKHKRQHTRHKPAPLALASSTTTIIVHMCTGARISGAVGEQCSRRKQKEESKTIGNHA